MLLSQPFRVLVQLLCVSMHRLESVILAAAWALLSGAQIVTLQTPQFRSVYNLETLCPQQVSWVVRQSDIGLATREPSWKFTNFLLDTLATVCHADFTKSGYDRGHMCPAADRSSDLRAMRSTFELVNVAPQVPSLNRGAWKRTESFCRSAALLYDSIQVLAMPVFLDRDTIHIGANHIAVPHAFFKAAWKAGTDEVIGVWFFFNSNAK